MSHKYIKFTPVICINNDIPIEIIAKSLNINMEYLAILGAPQYQYINVFTKNKDFIFSIPENQINNFFITKDEYRNKRINSLL